MKKQPKKLHKKLMGKLKIGPNCLHHFSSI
jgi:hypothetical protein